MAKPKKQADLAAMIATPAPALSTLVREAAALGSVDDVLARLTPEQLGALGKAALADELRAAVGQKIRAARVDLDTERAAWLACYSSAATVQAYSRSFDALAAWCRFRGCDLVTLSPADADAFILETRAAGGDTDSVRAVVFACSSFFRFAERRHSFVKNPFRGSRATPKRTSPRAVIPTPAEVETIRAAAADDPVLFAAVAVLTDAGLRIGALPGLTVRPDGSFTTTSKGKAVLSFVPLSPETVRLLSGRTPFAGETVGALRMRFARLVGRLHKAGKVAAPYSVHDLRHAFAERNKGRGLYWLARALGHASVSVTETYLRNALGIDPRNIEDAGE